MTDSLEPVACTLTTADAAKQAMEWTDLQGHVRAVSDIDRGVQMRFPVELTDVIVDLAAREAACCGFLRLTTTVDDDEVLLEITSDNPDGRPVIAMLAGLDPGSA
jgi:hypothetical protein